MDLIATIAFELRDATHEREVRSFLEALDVDYYVLQNQGANAGITNFGVVVVNTKDMITVGAALAPRGN